MYRRAQVRRLRAAVRRLRRPVADAVRQIDRAGAEAGRRAALADRAALLGLRVPEDLWTPPAGAVQVPLPGRLSDLPVGLRPDLPLDRASYAMQSGWSSLVIADVPHESRYNARGDWRTSQRSDRRVSVRSVAVVHPAGDRVTLMVGTQSRQMDAPVGSVWVAGPDGVVLRGPDSQVSLTWEDIYTPDQRETRRRASIYARALAARGHCAGTMVLPGARIIMSRALADAAVLPRLDLARCLLCSVRVAGVSPAGVQPIHAHMCTACGAWAHSECAALLLHRCGRYGCHGELVLAAWISSATAPIEVARVEAGRMR